MILLLIAFFPKIRILFLMVVRMRHTRSHTKNRRSHHALGKLPIIVDGKTGVAHLRHHASLTTGTYRGRQILDTMKKVEKKTEKAKKKAK